MNKKLQYELLLIVLITIVIFNLAIVFTSHEETNVNYYNVTEVGHNVTCVDVDEKKKRISLSMRQAK